MGKKGFLLKIRGYIRPESDHFVAVCIDLDLAGQGKTPDEAMQSLLGAINVYLDYVADHPDELGERIPRKASLEFRFTYYLIAFAHFISGFTKWWTDFTLFERKVIPGQLRLA